MTPENKPPLLPDRIVMTDKLKDMREKAEKIISMDSGDYLCIHPKAVIDLLDLLGKANEALFRVLANLRKEILAEEVRKQAQQAFNDIFIFRKD